MHELHKTPLHVALYVIKSKKASMPMPTPFALKTPSNHQSQHYFDKHMALVLLFFIEAQAISAQYCTRLRRAATTAFVGNHKQASSIVANYNTSKPSQSNILPQGINKVEQRAWQHLDLITP